MNATDLTRRTLLTAILGSVALTADTAADGAGSWAAAGAMPGRGGGGSPPEGDRARAAGVNLPPLAWYIPLRSMTNLAAYGAWQQDARNNVVDPAVIDANGDIVAFPKGAGHFLKALGLPSTSKPTRIRIECTGAPIDGLYQPDAAPTIADETRGTDKSVDPPIHWHEATYTVPLADVKSAPMIQIKSPAVRNLFCAEVTGRTPDNGTRTPFVETGFWHSRFVEIVSAFGEIRFMDPSFVNDDCGHDFADPVTAANRARRRQAMQPNRGTAAGNGVGVPEGSPNPCHVTAGGLTLYPADVPTDGGGMAQIGQQRWAAIQQAPATVTALPGVAEFMPYGASGNAMTLVVTAPAATGSVSMDPLSLTISVTPVTGAEGGDAVLRQIAATADARVRAVLALTRCQGTAQPVPPGSYPFSGGFNPQVQGDLGIEEAVDLCIAAKCNMHWNLPIAVADDYLALVGRELARLIPHGLRADVEVGNEVWNGAFATQFWQLAARAMTRNTYGMVGHDPLGNASGFVLASAVELTAHARSVIAPFFAAAPQLLRFGLNLQPGLVTWEINALRGASPEFARAYDAAIDVNMVGCYVDADGDEPYKLDGTPAWTAGTAYLPDTLASDGAEVYFARTAVSGATPPHLDTAGWGRLADDQAAIARILKRNIDHAMVRRALDAGASKALGKQFKVYEGAFQITTNDGKLIDTLTSGTGVADAASYLMDRFRAQCGRDASFLWYCLVYADQRGWSLAHSTEALPTPKSRAFAGG